MARVLDAALMPARIDDEKYSSRSKEELIKTLQIYRDNLADSIARLMPSYNAQEEYKIPVNSITKNLSLNKIAEYHRRISKIIAALKKKGSTPPVYVPSTLQNARELFPERQKAIYRSIHALGNAKETDVQTKARLQLFSDIIQATKSKSNTILRNISAAAGRGDSENIRAAHSAALAARPNMHSPPAVTATTAYAGPVTERPSVMMNEELRAAQEVANAKKDIAERLRLREKLEHNIKEKEEAESETCGPMCLQRGRQWPAWLRSVFGRATTGGTRHIHSKKHATRKRSS
jgi:hypothetical protein